MFIYIGGTLIGFWTLVHLVPGGWETISAKVSEAHKFRVFDFEPSWTKPYNFIAGVLGGTFLTTASHGTDQLMVQRLLAAKNERESKFALLSSGGAILMQFTLFLLVGASLWVFYHGVPAKELFGRADRIFPSFIVSSMPMGISGLLIAAILAAAMSNMSAALNSLSSSTVVDFYLRRKPLATEIERMRISRWATVGWAAVLFFLAVGTQFAGQRVLELGLSLASIPYGGLLGVFLLGVLTKRATESGALIGMACGAALNLWLWIAPMPEVGWMQTKVAFTWYVVLGTSVTFIVGYFCSLWTGERKAVA